MTDIETFYLTSEKQLPLVIQAKQNSTKLIDWASNNKDFLETQLVKDGAILFRKFSLEHISNFQRFIETIAGELSEYQDKATPRHQVAGKIYSSTDYPRSHYIFFHNENSFAHTFPQKIFFFCLTPSEKGGQTPLADIRKVYQHIPSSIREKFKKKKVLYVRNFGRKVGLSWQNVFNTSNPTELEKYGQQAGIKLEWKSEGRLRTYAVREACAEHPQTKEMIWFNHVAVLHISTLPPLQQKMLLEEFAPEDLPNNTYYGDGTEIEPEVLNIIRDAYQQEQIMFSWQQGDVLMVDNLLVAHGRKPYSGRREIVVGMAQSISWEELTRR